MKSNDVYKRENDLFDLELRIKSEEFLPTLQDFQEEWLVNKLMNEAARDLEQTSELSRNFVHGTKRPEMPENWGEQDVAYDDKQLVLKGHQVMQAWEDRIMSAMAENITQTHGDILEIGFGMGISATHILEQGVNSYTVVEPNICLLYTSPSPRDS